MFDAIQHKSTLVTRVAGIVVTSFTYAPDDEVEMCFFTSGPTDVIWGVGLTGGVIWLG